MRPNFVPLGKEIPLEQRRERRVPRKKSLFWGHDLDLLGSRDVIGHVTIGLAVCDFLYAVSSNDTSIRHGYGDKPQTVDKCQSTNGRACAHTTSDRTAQKIRSSV